MNIKQLSISAIIGSILIIGGAALKVSGMNKAMYLFCLLSGAIIFLLAMAMIIIKAIKSSDRI